MQLTPVTITETLSLPVGLCADFEFPLCSVYLKKHVPEGHLTSAQRDTVVTFVPCAKTDTSSWIALVQVRLMWSLLPPSSTLSPYLPSRSLLFTNYFFRMSQAIFVADVRFRTSVSATFTRIFQTVNKSHLQVGLSEYHCQLYPKYVWLHGLCMLHNFEELEWKK